MLFFVLFFMLFFVLFIMLFIMLFIPASDLHERDCHRSIIASAITGADVNQGKFHVLLYSQALFLVTIITNLRIMTEL